MSLEFADEVCVLLVGWLSKLNVSLCSTPFDCPGPRYERLNLQDIFVLQHNPIQLFDIEFPVSLQQHVHCWNLHVSQRYWLALETAETPNHQENCGRLSGHAIHVDTRAFNGRWPEST